MAGELLHENAFLHCSYFCEKSSKVKKLLNHVFAHAIVVLVGLAEQVVAQQHHSTQCVLLLTLIVHDMQVKQKQKSGVRKCPLKLFMDSDSLSHFNFLFSPISAL